MHVFCVTSLAVIIQQTISKMCKNVHRWILDVQSWANSCVPACGKLPELWLILTKGAIDFPDLYRFFVVPQGFGGH